MQLRTGRYGALCGLLAGVGLGPTWRILGDSPAIYPLKPPLVLYHSCGSASSFFRHPVHVRLTIPASRAFFPNLMLSVRNLSFVSRLFRAFLHLVVVSPSMLLRSSPSSSLILLSFLIFHISLIFYPWCGTRRCVVMSYHISRIANMLAERLPDVLKLRVPFNPP